MALADHLEAGTAAGIISAEQAVRLAHFIAERDAAGEDPGADAEAVRFARGFHDVFLTIGLAILLVGVTLSAGLVVGNSAGFIGAAAAWALAEYYARRRRLVLPSIALAAGFALMVAVSAGDLAPALIGGGFVETGEGRPWFLLLGALAGLAAAAGFFARFRLPFAVGIIAATASATVGAAAAVAWPEAIEDLARPILMICGLAVFIAAMANDLADPARTTLSADNAFWLHLVAAPLIVHSAVGFMIADGVDMPLADALAVFAVIGAVAIVALVVDRRALLVAGLAYLGVAIAVVVREAEADTGSAFAITLLFLGAAVVALGTGWRPARRAVVAAVVPAVLARRLPAIGASPA